MGTSRPPLWMGTSIRAGPLQLNAPFSSFSSSVVDVARMPLAPKLSANATKSGLTKSEPIKKIVGVLSGLLYRREDNAD